MIEKLLLFDTELFLKINTVWTRPWADAFFPILTDLFQYWWIAKIVFPIVLLIWIFAARWKAVGLILGMALAVGMADASAYRIVKSAVERPRPYKVLAGQAVLRTHEHAGFSFPSNHAANNFAWASYLAYFHPELRIAAFTTAALVAYSRIYVGVHYPLDVIVGAIIGIICARISILISLQGIKIFRRIRKSSDDLPNPPSHLKR